MLNLRSYFPAFRTPENIITGNDSVAALRGLTAVRAAVIAGSSLLNNDKLRSLLEENIRAHDVCFIKKSWNFEPTLEDLAPTIGEIEAFKPDVIIAVGGGSVLDGARLVWMHYEHPDIPKDTLYRPFASPPLRGKCNFVAMPTTVGTGSEVSSAAVISDSVTHKKIPIVTHDFIPDLAILDPQFVVELPKHIIASTSIDAISHVVEGYVSTLPNPFTDALAEKALQMIVEWGPIAIETSSQESMEQLLTAASLAGVVQNHCLTGAAHAIAHQIGQFGIGHGHANAIVLPIVIAFNCQNEKAKERYTRLAKTSGIGSNEKDIVDFLYSYAAMGGLNLSLGKLTDTSKLDIDSIAKAALTDPNARTNPVELNIENVKELIEKCL